MRSGHALPPIERICIHAGGKQRRGNGRLGKGGQFKQKINHRRWESGRRWIAFNRVSRWPLLFSRKNHRNEIASLSIIRISLSLSLSRCATNVVSPCFLTREDYFGYCVECFRFLETERSVLIAINSQWWWGGGRKRCLEFRLFIGSRGFLDYFPDRDRFDIILDSWKPRESTLSFFKLKNFHEENSSHVIFCTISSTLCVEFISDRSNILGTENFGKVEKYIYNSREFSYSNLKMSRADFECCVQWAHETCLERETLSFNATRNHRRNRKTVSITK